MEFDLAIVMRYETNFFLKWLSSCPKTIYFKTPYSPKQTECEAQNSFCEWWITEKPNKLRDWQPQETTTSPGLKYQREKEMFLKPRFRATKQMQQSWLSVKWDLKPSRNCTSCLSIERGREMLPFFMPSSLPPMVPIGQIQMKFSYWGAWAMRPTKCNSLAK